MRKVMEKNLRRTAAVALALVLAAGLSACGGSKEAAQPGAEESAAAASTVSGPINPEEYKSEEVIKEEPAKEARKGRSCSSCYGQGRKQRRDRKA